MPPESARSPRDGRPAVLDRLVPRHLASTVLDRMRREPVVVLQGPRTVGKSTLVRAVADEVGAVVHDLDDLATRAAVDADPTLFVAGESPVIIDEYQHVPVLLDAIKAELNTDLRAGRFLLTGSTRYGSSPRTAQSLAGRAHVVTLWPLSQGELDGRVETFLDQLLSDPSTLVSPRPSSTERAQYVARVLAGGFPLALARPTYGERRRWFADFVQLVVDKDVLEIRNVRQREKLPRFLARLASQTGQVLNLAQASRVVGIDPTVGDAYVQLLEAVFLVRRLPAWGRTLGSRVAARPKVHITDPGLAAHLLGVTPERLESKDPAILTEFGHIAEAFVVGELTKQAGWCDEPVQLAHYRTHDDVEVDLVVQRTDGHVAAVEVKASSSVKGSDLSPLQRLRDKLGPSFVGGVALYLGPRSYTFSDRIHVVPLDRIWT